ncbi:hypothetical protein ABTX60_16140 [Streptomyces sp. NPDC126510]|uniref:hypothetical protein n=1 Tax=Streptomyces sp. NPDC126510 TaxID=3155317 RepID=UPI0033315C40
MASILPTRQCERESRTSLDPCHADGFVRPDQPALPGSVPPGGATVPATARNSTAAVVTSSARPVPGGTSNTVHTAPVKIPPTVAGRRVLAGRCFAVIPRSAARGRLSTRRHGEHGHDGHPPGIRGEDRGRIGHAPSVISPDGGHRATAGTREPWRDTPPVPSPPMTTATDGYGRAATAEPAPYDAGRRLPHRPRAG